LEERLCVHPRHGVHLRPALPAEVAQTTARARDAFLLRLDDALCATSDALTLQREAVNLQQLNAILNASSTHT
jgi:hypothetical protein